MKSAKNPFTFLLPASLLPTSLLLTFLLPTFKLFIFLSPSIFKKFNYYYIFISFKR